MRQETQWTNTKGHNRQMTAACLARLILPGRNLDWLRSHRHPKLIGALEAPGDVDGVRRDCKTVLVFVPGPPRFCGAQQLQLSKAKAGLPATILIHSQSWRSATMHMQMRCSFLGRLVLPVTCDSLHPGLPYQIGGSRGPQLRHKKENIRGRMGTMYLNADQAGWL